MLELLLAMGFPAKPSQSTSITQGPRLALQTPDLLAPSPNPQTAGIPPDSRVQTVGSHFLKINTIIRRFHYSRSRSVRYQILAFLSQPSIPALPKALTSRGSDEVPLFFAQSVICDVDHPGPGLLVEMGLDFQWGSSEMAPRNKCRKLLPSRMGHRSRSRYASAWQE